MKRRELCVFLFMTAVLVSVSNSQVYAQVVAPDFTLTDIDGKDFSLSDYRGRVVLLEFFATWCSWCVKEIPHLKSLNEEFGEDLIIISISVAPSDTVEKLQQFRQGYGIGWIVAGDTIGIHDEYGVTTLPTLVIIDQEGYIRYRHVGLTDESILREEIQEIIPKLPGDVNDDGVVDLFDALWIANTFGSTPGDPNWYPECDLHEDEIIDIFDALVVSGHFGETV